eukprot:TRINITY_DN27108_c0_g1_i1.p1 TRINITY_DN27108_c0_g1~~TRINITY_DN27108_c0_g1_i1.p1  ORF type:complete len:358 (-),score=74.18 TRINITY_DN27108_c0_g1_i1:395-1468(-)
MVRSMSRLGIGLSVVFGCFLLALVAELYYVLCWRRRLSSGSALNGELEDQFSSPSRELFYLLCWKRKKKTLNPQHQNQQQPLRREIHCSDVSSNAQNPNSNQSSFIKFFPPTEGMDTEIMRLHSLLGPPRVLFTIKEETKEDLDSEDGRSKKSRRGSRNRSLSDLLGHIGGTTVTPLDSSSNTPYATPPSSPPFSTPMATPPLTPLAPYPPLHMPTTKSLRLSPLSDASRTSSSTSSASVSSSFPSSFSSSETQSPFLSPLQENPKPAKVVSSPPPKFKFLRDAEEKAASKQQLQDQQQVAGGAPSSPSSCSAMSSDEDGSFITIIVGESNSCSNSVVPHPSSPITTPNHTHVMPRR